MRGTNFSSLRVDVRDIKVGQVGNSRSKWFRVTLLSVGLVLVAWQARELLRTATPPNDDFIQYWAASRLLIAGGNPYSPEQLLRVQRPFFDRDAPLIMWNPPWTLALLLPFGLMSFTAARWLWLIVNLTAVILSTRWLWRFYVRRDFSWIGLVVAFTFFPVPVVLGLGQIGPLILGGVAGFLCMIALRRDLSAGAFTLLIALKPQLLWLFWVALLIWVIRWRRWRVLVGACLALGTATFVVLLFNLKVPACYLELAGSESFLHYPSTTLGALARALFGWERRWLQWLPLTFGLLWLVFSGPIRRDGGWDWPSEMPVLLVVSVITTCYGWIFDQVVLLPSVFQSTSRLLVVNHRPYYVTAGSVYLGINALGAVLVLLGGNGIRYVWMAPVWLLASWLLRRKAERDQPHPVHREIRDPR